MLKSRSAAIVAALHQLGYENIDIAEKTECRPNIIADIIKKKRQFSINNIQALFDNLKVNPMYFFAEDAPMFIEKPKPLRAYRATRTAVKLDFKSARDCARFFGVDVRTIINKARGDSDINGYKIREV